MKSVLIIFSFCYLFTIPTKALGLRDFIKTNSQSIKTTNDLKNMFNSLRIRSNYEVNSFYCYSGEQPDNVSSIYNLLNLFAMSSLLKTEKISPEVLNHYTSFRQKLAGCRLLNSTSFIENDSWSMLSLFSENEFSRYLFLIKSLVDQLDPVITSGAPTLFKELYCDAFAWSGQTEKSLSCFTELFKKSDSLKGDASAIIKTFYVTTEFYSCSEVVERMKSLTSGKKSDINPVILNLTKIYDNSCKNLYDSFEKLSKDLVSNIKRMELGAEWTRILWDLNIKKLIHAKDFSKAESEMQIKINESKRQTEKYFYNYYLAALLVEKKDYKAASAKISSIPENVDLGPVLQLRVGVFSCYLKSLIQMPIACNYKSNLGSGDLIGINPKFILLNNLLTAYSRNGTRSEVSILLKNLDKIKGNIHPFY